MEYLLGLLREILFLDEIAVRVQIGRSAAAA